MAPTGQRTNAGRKSHEPEFLRSGIVSPPASCYDFVVSWQAPGIAMTRSLCPRELATV
jgi:hypothetical protein